MKILIAEDDLTSRAMLSAVLKKWDCVPVTANDGMQAWDILQQPDAPRLLILDWVMPELDGLSLCRRVREHNTSDPPYVILLTGKGETNDIVEALDAGANDYITKPYDNAELRARIGVGMRMLELQADLNGAKNALAHEAMHDALTGIFNRRAILDGLAREISRAKRQGSTLSVGLCDIDHFKQINDQYGHMTGDEVLNGFARIMQENMRTCDLLGRYGGEEFLVIAPGSKGAPQEVFYERLCEAVAAASIPTRTGNISIAISIGVAGGAGDITVDALLAAADTALYNAKNTGRNRVAYASE